MRQQESRVVLTSSGPVQGLRLAVRGREVDAFLGIPYAKPPLGPLRFQKPEPTDALTETRSVKKFPKRSIQKNLFFLDRWLKGPCSEDCLQLNVWTPTWNAPGKEGFAVMVYIHGGGYVMDGTVTYGSKGIAKYLVTKDVIVVTVQYRLGFLGFFTTGDSACPGNLGLWDQTAALRWVQENIGAFGGDKGNVTLFGQSAGGASVHLLTLSPHSNNLFARVCPLAGNAAAHWAVNPECRVHCRAKAKELGIQTKNTAEQMAMLRELPASKLPASPIPKPEERSDQHKLDITPVIDGDFLPEPIAVLRKKTPAKPMLIGICRLECLLFMAFGNLKPTIVEIRGILSEMLPEGVNGEEKEKLIEQLFPLFLPENHDKLGENQLSRAYIEAICKIHLICCKVHLTNFTREHHLALSDLMFNTSTLETIKDNVHNSWPAPVYSYIFDYVNPKSFGLFGFKFPFKESTHCTELAYLFGKGIIFNFSFSEDDKKMADLFSSAFTNFAKYGNPNGKGGEECSDLKMPFLPATAAEPERHYVFDLRRPRMESTFFEGRLAKEIQVREECLRSQSQSQSQFRAEINDLDNIP